MADVPSADCILSGDNKHHPSKRPCLDPASNRMEPGGAPVEDEGSDFYTPINGGTPVPTAQNSLAEDNNHIIPPALPKTAPAIPGLTFLYETTAAAESQTVEGSGHSDAVEKTSSLDRACELGMSQELDKQVPAPNDVEMRTASPEDQHRQGEHQSRSHTAPEESENDIPSVPEVSKESIPPTHNGVLGNPHAGGSEIGSDNSENPEWEIDSSPYESSSSDSSSDSSDDDGDSSDDYDLLDPEEQARILMAAEGGSDDEGDEKHKGAHIRTANEKPEEIVPKPDITVTPEMKVEVLGNVETIVENVVLIKANISGEYQVLESGSVLCLADLSVIGMVSETLGRVEQPRYTVRFPNEESIKEAKLDKGTPVFYVVDHSTFVFTQPLKGLKGSDASNFHDEEVGEEEIEFSDDEAEAQYKRQLKQKRQGKKDGHRDANGHGKQRRDRLGPSGVRSSEINYDDINTEDGYTPLSRPKNFHEMIGHTEAPTEESHLRNQFAERHSRGGRGRGRGRGSDRGERGRGRGGSYKKHGDDRQPQQSQNHPEQPQRQQQETSQHTYPRQSAEFTQAFYQAQNLSQQHSVPYNSSSYPHQTSQQNQTSQVFNTNQTFSTPGFLPTQQQYLFQPLHQSQSSSPFPPPGSHINPAFFRNLQQQQQNPPYQPPQPAQQRLQSQYSSQVPTTQTSADTFAAAQAQLDLLRRLSRSGS
ncbi:snoRNP assembly factor Naf1 [Histoplasma ohiense]|nr:snoRNP assembly factor Naf1 [Histoplasma ohiense (nom. inval.)]